MNQSALKLIREFEGLRLNSYLDGVGVPTIGYGSTHWPNGKPVEIGQTCTEEEAEDMLNNFIQEKIAPSLAEIPGWDDMGENKQAALISFAYNLGPNFYKGDNFHTISKYLTDKNWDQVPEALMLYVSPGTPVEAGLRRRRREEGRIWSLTTSTAKQAILGEITQKHWVQCWHYFKDEPQQIAGVEELYKAMLAQGVDLLDSESSWFKNFTKPRPKVHSPNCLPVPYQSQRDNYRDAYRTCFSSSCAMLVMQLHPGLIHSDDEYIHEVFAHGDTTDATVQLSALKHFGVNARFVTNASKETLKNQIDKGIPVPCGYLHHGPPSHPAGGGHWLAVIGYDSTGVFVNDPWGSCDLLSGTFPSQNGAKQHYSDANWTNTRWMADGPSTGWAIIAET